MRRVLWLPLTLLLTAAGAAPALAAPGRSACDLAGFVRTSAARCPDALGARAGAAPQPQLLGVIGGLFGDGIKKVLSTIVSWANDSAADALRFTATLIGSSTQPALQSTWFSETYWRVAALSALLTVPFLFAAAVHAIVRSDLALLGRAAFGYLPLAMIGVAIAAPLTAIVLSATDEMCSFVAAAGGNIDTTFLGHAASSITDAAIIDGDPFVAFFAGVITVAATLSLWLELLVRDAAVDVIVLMLPLFFAAMVWPARRIWAIRAVETLFALILAKFAIIAVLTLGGAALDNAASGLAALLSGATLILLATASPWALLRILPLHEVAAAAAGGLSQGPKDAVSHARGKLTGSSGQAQASEHEPPGNGEAEAAIDSLGLERLTRSPAALPQWQRDGHHDEARGAPGAHAPSGLDPETAMGLAAVPRAGSSAPPEPDLGTEAANGAGGGLTDNRPPINEAFGHGERMTFILGDGETERMSAPRFVGGPGNSRGADAPSASAPGSGPASVAPAPAAPPSAGAVSSPGTEPPPDEPPRVEPPPIEPARVESPPVEPPPIMEPPAVPPRPSAGRDRSADS